MNHELCIEIDEEKTNCTLYFEIFSRSFREIWQILNLLKVLKRKKLQFRGSRLKKSLKRPSWIGTSSAAKMPPHLYNTAHRKSSALAERKSLFMIGQIGDFLHESYAFSLVYTDSDSFMFPIFKKKFSKLSKAVFCSFVNVS